MKVVILAGGRGTRLSEVTGDIPKPMIRIGGKPILQHIMEIYAKHGLTDFVIAGGYKIGVIDDWLRDAYIPWKVNLVDTGLDTLTGGRVAALRMSERFALTYGDGLANVDITALLKLHQFHESYCTLTAVHPPARFGHLELGLDYVKSFQEKPIRNEWINGGFFIVEPEAVQFVGMNDTWEVALTQMSLRNLLTAYRHTGYWQCLDTMREVQVLEAAAKDGTPWLK
jgi:glucose-1-phosphate cytidylyltransferase